MEEGSRDWPAADVITMTQDHAPLADGESRASEYFAEYLHPMTTKMSPTYEERRNVRVDDVIWMPMVASAPTDPQAVVHYGSRTPSAVDPAIEEGEVAEKVTEECNEWKPCVLDSVRRKDGGQKQGGYQHASPATPERRKTLAKKIRVKEIEKAYQDAKNACNMCAAELAKSKEQVKAKTATPAG